MVVCGEIIDGVLKELLIGVNVIIKGIIEGIVIDYDGSFFFNILVIFLFMMVFFYIGYQDVEIFIELVVELIKIEFLENFVMIVMVEVKG